MTLPAPAGAYGAADPIFLILAALAAEAYFGSLPAVFRRLPHPRGLLARLAQELNRRLNRPGRGRRALLLRGVFAVVTLVAAAVLGGLLLALATRHYPFAWVIEWLLLITLVAQRTTWNAVDALAEALERGSVERARDRLRQLAGERLPSAVIEGLDARGLVLAGLEGLAGRFALALVAPVFWYLLGGLPGLFAFLAVRAGAAVFAPAEERLLPESREASHKVSPGESPQDFALAATQLLGALAWIPERLAAILLALAGCFVPGGRPWLAVKRLPRARDWPVAALGGALGLAARQDRAPARAAVEPLTLRRAQLLLAVACLIHAGLLAGLALLGLIL